MKVERCWIILMLFIFAFSLFLSPDSAAQSKKILAKVNGEPITEEEYGLEKYLESEFIKRSYSSLQGKEYEAAIEKLKRDFINSAIEKKLLMQEAKKRGIAVDEKEITKKIDALISSFGSKEELLEDCRQINKTPDITWQELENDYRKHYREEAIRLKFQEQVGVQRITVLNNEIKNYYNKNKSQFARHGEIILCHYWVNSLEMAEKLKDEFVNKFEGGFQKNYSLIEKYGGMKQETYLDTEKLPDYAEEAHMLKSHEFSKIKRTSDGKYHFIEFYRHEPERILEFEKVKENIKVKLLKDKRDKKWKEFIDGLKKKAKIENYLFSKE